MCECEQEEDDEEETPEELNERLLFLIDHVIDHSKSGWDSYFEELKRNEIIYKEKEKYYIKSLNADVDVRDAKAANWVYCLTGFVVGYLICLVAMAVTADCPNGQAIEQQSKQQSTQQSN